MKVPITQFRKDLFSLVKQAMRGTEICVKHKGGRFKSVPDKRPASKLSRLTPADLINYDVPGDGASGSLPRRGYFPCRSKNRSINFVSNVPDRNSSSAKIFWCSGIVV